MDKKALIMQETRSHYPEVHDGLTADEALALAGNILRDDLNIDAKRRQVMLDELRLLGSLRVRAVWIWLRKDDGTGDRMGEDYLGEESEDTRWMVGEEKRWIAEEGN